jgi:homogentisate 1,2-dioxygenase
MDYFFEHHSATMVFFVHEGRGTLETTFGPIEYTKGDFLIVPKGVTHRFELGPGVHYYWMYESFAGDPEKSEAPTTGQFITHSRSDYRFPRSLATRNESGLPRPRARSAARSFRGPQRTWVTLSARRASGMIWWL